MSQPIRVLCLFSVLSRGGAETMCMNLYRKIDKKKVQFDFVKNSSIVGAYEDEIKKLGGKIFKAPKYKIYNHLDYIRWWKKHFKNHPEHKIIHGHYFTIAPIVFKLAHKFERITVGHAHTSKPKYKKFKLTNLLKELLVKKIEEHSDFCFACSKDSGEYFYKNKEFVILNNAIDSQKFEFDSDMRNKVRQELNLDETNFVVGTVGSFTGVKNPMFTVEIIKHLAKETDKLQFVWVGDGDLKNQVIEELDKSSLKDRVIFTGSRGDVHHLLQAMDVFILPSLFEGLPVVSIEAQSSGLPTLLSENVSREAAKTDLCEFLPINNPSDWAKKIFSYKDNFKRVSTKQKIIEAGYDIEATAEFIQSFYLNISKDD